MNDNQHPAPIIGTTYEAAANALVLDAAVSFALKRRIQEDQERDPLDALRDAQALQALQQLRCDELLSPDA